MGRYIFLRLKLILLALVWVFYSSPIKSQEEILQEAFEIHAPSARVKGSPGLMMYLKQDCDSKGIKGLRQRIVYTAMHEWAYFGFQVYDLTHTRDDNPDYVRQPWTRPVIEADEAIRVADAIAGYWSSTPDSQWILERQNQYWKERGAGSRWRNPWSAAFISWVICESGVDELSRFKRAVAHHAYIDQAIVNREKDNKLGLYFAYDVGEETIQPGDLLCRGSRPNYNSLEDRKAQLGVGARTHCDFVVKLDKDNDRIMVIGGNVRAWVRLKLLPGDYSQDGKMIPAPYDGRRVFAHLKLQANSVSDLVFEKSLPLLQPICGKSEIDIKGTTLEALRLCFD